MKKFAIKSLYFFIPFCCVWTEYNVLNKNHAYITGDLGILGQIPFGQKYVQYLDRHYLPDYLVIDTGVVANKKLQISNASNIFTIGDSFSQQAIPGYQNHLAHLLGLKIVNIKNSIPKSPFGSFRTGLQLLNSGVIDSTNCKIVISECVDRDVIKELDNINFEEPYKLPEKNNSQSKPDKNTDAALYNLCWWARLQIGYDDPVLEYNLKQDCFTHDYYSHKLFCYKEDMLFRNTSKNSIEKAKENLILLNKKFSEKGIKMIFLIAADKYDVYRPFMTDNSLPVNTTTDGLSNTTGVCEIDTKPILQNMVGKGEKDVYMVNDSHWSYKGSEAVEQKLAHAIDSLEILTR
jgi:hypothetical protein